MDLHQPVPAATDAQPVEIEAEEGGQEAHAGSRDDSADRG
jgi:hypothetical protein